MTRCPEECGRQWRPVQGKSGWEKQKEEEAKEEVEKKKEEKCYGTLNTNNFLFYFLLFFLILLFFSFSLFYFPGETMKKACDKEVT